MLEDLSASTKTFDKNSYRPLPKCLTIRGSKIDGLGLFATQDIQGQV